MMEGAISALKESGSTDANDANAQGHRSCDGKQENSVLYFFFTLQARNQDFSKRVHIGSDMDSRGNMYSP